MRIQTPAANGSHIEAANIAFQVVTIALIGLSTLAATVRFLAGALA